jgi:hypothetical protein
MAWTYQQNSGRLSDPNGALQGVGYSGQPPHTNAPADEGLEGLGPIPRGIWTKKSVEWDNPKLGPFVIVLEPDETTRARIVTLGRDPDSFRMHGERLPPAPPGFASDGCIVQIRQVRENFWNSPDPVLEVV